MISYTMGIMHELSDKQEKQALGEILKDKLDAIMEVVSDVPHIKRQVGAIDKRLKSVESDVKVIKAVVTDQSHTLERHDQAIKTLQQTAR